MGPIVEVLWGRTEVRMGAAGALLVALVVGALSARRGRGWLVPFGLTASCGLVLVSTLFGVAGQPGAGVAWWSQCRVEGASELVASLRNPEGLANVVLFVPFGLFASLAARQAAIGIAAALSLSVIVELIQGLTWARDCTSGDVTANVLGAALGAALALTGARLRRRMWTGRVTRASRPSY